MATSTPGGSAVHFVIRHDRLMGPPIASRFLLVGLDAHLRCCVASESGGARMGGHYNVTAAPEDLPLRALLDALSSLIARLESTETQLEIRQITRDVKSEEPVRPGRDTCQERRVPRHRRVHRCHR
jgi:hypothetical protein